MRGFMCTHNVQLHTDYRQYGADKTGAFFSVLHTTSALVFPDFKLNSVSQCFSNCHFGLLVGPETSP
jgi:hypothetical protein